MRLPGVPYQPRYTSDEVVLGVVVAAALHVLAVGPFVVKAVWPSAAGDEEKPLVARPFIQASLLKLGKPIDPKQLPQRFVPQARTAPKKQLVASREDPVPQKKDAGAAPPPVEADDGAIANLIAKTDPFAEDAGKARPEEGHPAGVDGGQETDPNKVKAGDMYAALLSKFFADRLQYPTVISQAEAKRLCVTYQVRISPQMVVWYLRSEPIKKSGNELFDDAARAMIQKLLDDKSALPAPPKDVEETFRGKMLNIAISGDMHGDGSRCK